MERWIAVARSRTAGREAAGARSATNLDEAAWDRAARAHLLTQFAHLAGYPTLERRRRAGGLRLHAWFYTARTGAVEVYHPRDNAFRPLTREPQRN